MRQIKFRLWDKVYKRWFEDGFTVAWDGTEYYDDNDSWMPKVDYCLMQFTGLKDKNGKDIYEGDIIEVKDYDNNKIVGVVQWSESFVGWAYTDEAFEYRLSSTAQMMRKIKGNIYEHPNLLTHSANKGK